MTVTLAGEDRAAHLVHILQEKGALHSSEWARAVAEVPRHVFVPRFYEQVCGSWRLVDSANPTQRDRWLDAVYSDTGLTIALDPESRDQISSSSQPALMVRMLEALDLQDGQRVLEIGTGTGYNAGLLCHRLGDERVYSVDVEPDLVQAARDRLALLGYHPTLAACDGAGGLPEYAPYDRIIATCSVPGVPWAWARQLVDGGLLLADVKVGPYAGNLVLLRRRGDELTGHFLPKWAGFMGIRRPGPPPPRGQADTPVACIRHTTLPALPWENLPAWFLAQLAIRTPVSFGYVLNPNTGQPSHARYTTADGSWCDVALDGGEEGRVVREGGPRPLWALVEAGFLRWREAGKPGWERFGMTATEHRQWVWLDDPEQVVAVL
ncbi:MAG TPA: methyltransferase domain-containing protein [Pseudonocardiaceae bacterium]